MMVDAPRQTLPWTCPVCTDRIDVTMWWEETPQSFLRVRRVDDLDARLHMEWHRLCICRWEHVHSDEKVEPVAVLFRRDPGCEMHP